MQNGLAVESWRLFALGAAMSYHHERRGHVDPWNSVLVTEVRDASKCRKSSNPRKLSIYIQGL